MDGANIKLPFLEISWSWREWFGWIGGNVSNYHYFNDEEVAKWQLDPELWAMLDMARDKAGVPFIITSGRRTIEQETALKGGVRDSAHINGLGVDIATGDDNRLCLILSGLFITGFRRIGIYHDAQFVPHHIHADIDKTLPPNVCWLLLEQNC